MKKSFPQARLDCPLFTIFLAVLKELDTDIIDVLLLSVSEKPNVIETFHMDHLKTLWSVLERMVDKGQIKTLGVCDLEKPALEELYNWAKVKVDYRN